MSAYQRSTGLKPSGLHRPTADRMLRGGSQRCVHCGGDGHRAVGRSWLWCEACGGLGRLMTPKAQFTLRRQVMERYPASAIEGRPGEVAQVSRIDPVMKLDRVERRRTLSSWNGSPRKSQCA
jgi:hypothetical protein